MSASEEPRISAPAGAVAPAVAATPAASVGSAGAADPAGVPGVSGEVPVPCGAPSDVYIVENARKNSSDTSYDYYSCSTDDFYRVYDIFESELRKALLKGQKQVDISSLMLSNTDYYWGYFFSYSPYFYYLDDMHLFQRDGYLSHVEIEYDYTADEMRQLINDVDARVNYICQVASDLTSDFDKALAIHDFLIAYSEYYDDKTYDVHNAGGIIMDGAGVCQSFATAYMYIMNRLGVSCGLIEGPNHVWNTISIDGTWYEADLTSDNPSYAAGLESYEPLGSVSHKNFLCSRSEMLSSSYYLHGSARYLSNAVSTTPCPVPGITEADSPIAIRPAAGSAGAARENAGSAGAARENTGSAGAAKSGEYYCILDGSLVSLDLRTGSYTKLGASFESRGNSGLFLCGDSIIYNTPTELRSYSLSTSSERVLRESPSGRYFGGSYYRFPFICYNITSDAFSNPGDISLCALDGSDISGWCSLGGNWYYFDTDGLMACSDLYRVGRFIYSFDSFGAMRTGWRYISGHWYFFSSTGAAQTGWKCILGRWYYFDASGVMQTGWRLISGKWYYMDASGAMVTGWKQISGKWYYMDASGAMVTGWKCISGKWYYMDASGVMVTGWRNIGGKNYYFNAQGEMQG